MTKKKRRPYGHGMLVKDLATHFGVTQGSLSQRATTLLRAAGLPTEHYGGMYLGSPHFLVSSRRRQIIQRRDRYRSLDTNS